MLLLVLARRSWEKAWLAKATSKQAFDHMGAISQRKRWVWLKLKWAWPKPTFYIEHGVKEHFLPFFSSFVKGGFLLHSATGTHMINTIAAFGLDSVLNLKKRKCRSPKITLGQRSSNWGAPGTDQDNHHADKCFVYSEKIKSGSKATR